MFRPLFEHLNDDPPLAEKTAGDEKVAARLRRAVSAMLGKEAFEQMTQTPSTELPIYELVWGEKVASVVDDHLFVVASQFRESTEEALELYESWGGAFRTQSLSEK